MEWDIWKTRKLLLFLGHSIDFRQTLKKPPPLTAPRSFGQLGKNHETSVFAI